MSKKMLIFAALLFSLALLGGVLLFRSGILQEQAKTVQSVPEESGNKGKKEKPDAEEKTRQFVTDVDPNVSHWQTKETKTFTIKFPKEWHWIEFLGYDDQGSGGSHVISNNPNFPLKEYSDLSIFPNRSYKLVLKNNTEIVIDFNIYDYGPNTSNFGNPLDPVSDSNKFFYLVPRINSTAECESLLVQEGNSTNMTSVYCSIDQENHQRDIVYYRASKMFSLMLTLKSTDQLSIDSAILKDIAESFVLKY
ncbi:MAG: hypothetical protein IPL87_02580 [Candidatus Moraniibacteriota bacterium]|nr:MAG: hypothetical protein IPL87_02580 [Candidatus Moranbacteria bacterium]